MKKNYLSALLGLVFAGPRYIIEAELGGIREQTFNKQGANAIEAERIKERLDAGDSAEQISSDMMIDLACVESFRLVAGEERGPRPLWVGEPDGVRDDRPFYTHKGRPLRDPRTVSEGGILGSEELRVDAKGIVSSPKMVAAAEKAEAARVAQTKKDEVARVEAAKVAAKEAGADRVAAAKAAKKKEK